MKEFESDVLFSFNLIDEVIDTTNLLSGKITVSKDDIYIQYTSIINNPIEVFEKVFKRDTQIKYITVYGQTIKGEKFTAYKCKIENCYSNLASASIMTNTENITIGTLFFGEWIKDIDNIKINKGKVRFSYFEHWLHRFIVDKNINNQTIENFNIELEQFNKKLDVEIDDNITIKTSHGLEQKIENNKKFILDTEQFLECSFNQPISFKEYNEVIYDLKNFFRFILPNKNIFIEKQYVYLENKSIELYSSDKHYTPESDKVSWGNFLYLYNENTIDNVLINWFNSQKKYGRIFKVLSSILDKPPFMYVEHNFLNVVHWFESYCRVQYSATEQDTMAFANRMLNIINQIEDSEDKKFIKNISKNKEEAPFREQLIKVFNDIKIKEILSIGRDHFDSLVSHIQDNRNKLTHTSKDSNIPYSEINMLSEILRDVIFIILLKILKLDNDKHTITNIYEDLRQHYSAYLEVKGKYNERIPTIRTPSNRAFQKAKL